MTLHQFIAHLQKLAESDACAGSLPVLYRHGASGDCGPVGSAHVTDHQDDAGPFDIEPGDRYVSLYVGN
jgi:hypothetical protein